MTVPRTAACDAAVRCVNCLSSRSLRLGHDAPGLTHQVLALAGQHDFESGIQSALAAQGDRLAAALPSFAAAKRSRVGGERALGAIVRNQPAEPAEGRLRARTRPPERLQVLVSPRQQIAALPVSASFRSERTRSSWRTTSRE